MAMKKHIGGTLDPELVDGIRNAAWHVGKGTSLNSVLEEGALSEVATLERHHNDGKPFVPPDSPKPPPRRAMEKGKRNRLQTVSWRMYKEDQDRLRNAARTLGLSTTSIVEDGARKVLAALEQKYNNGQPFPPREGDLSGATPRDDQ